MAKLDVSNLFPWNKMEKRTVSGQSYIFIPKFYVCNDVAPAGADYAGKQRWLISEKPQDGYHIYPSFVTNGVENSEGVLIGEDIVDSNIAYTGIKDKAKNTYSAEPYNIYDHHLIARLMLIEYESADLQTLLTGSNTGMGATYHGIKNVWGAASKGEWFYGLDTVANGGGYHSINNTNIHILSNKMDGTFVDTGVAPCGGGWPVTLLTTKGTNFDLGDVFLAATVDSTEGNGTLGDYQYLYTGYAFSSSWNEHSGRGPFRLDYDSVTYTGSSLGFRLRKAA